MKFIQDLFLMIETCACKQSLGDQVKMLDILSTIKYEETTRTYATGCIEKHKGTLKD